MWARLKVGQDLPNVVLKPRLRLDMGLQHVYEAGVGPRIGSLCGSISDFDILKTQRFPDERTPTFSVARRLEPPQTSEHSRCERRCRDFKTEGSYPVKCALISIVTE